MKRNEEKVKGKSSDTIEETGGQIRERVVSNIDRMWQWKRPEIKDREGGHRRRLYPRTQ